MTHLLLHKTPNSVSSEPGAAQFVALDATSFPDLARQILSVILRPDRPLGWRYTAVLLSIDAAVSAGVLSSPETFLQIGSRAFAAALSLLSLVLVPPIDGLQRLFRLEGELFGESAPVAMAFTACLAVLFALLVPALAIRRYVHRRPQLHTLSAVTHFSSLPLVIGLVGVSVIASSLYRVAEEGDWYEHLLRNLFLYGLYAAIVLLPIAIFSTMRYVFGQLYDATIAAIRYLSPLLTVVCAVTSVITLLAFSSVFFYGAEEVVLLISVSVITPVMLIITIVVVIFFAKLFIDIIRKVALLVFEAASAPDMSPFSYAAALLGILVLGVKLILGGSSD